MNPSPAGVVARLQAGFDDAVAGMLAEHGAVEAAGLRARAEAVIGDLAEALTGLFGSAAPALAEEVARTVGRAAVGRREELRALDRHRESDSGWFAAPRMIGYAAYTDRFAGTLAGVHDRLDHLAGLGVTYLHLMPLLRGRDGEDDGGYAVAAYDQVDPRLGTMADLAGLADALHQRGMALCLDVVVNHTADSHPWARGAAAGDPALADRYLSFPDRVLPDAYERCLPEVFPATAPGNFTWVPEAGRWFWTTFHPWQWDLNHAAPGTFAAMLEVMLGLVELGVDVLRLDAVPFTGKRLGTDCQNQPEAHLLLQAYRALLHVAAPGVLCKAEAIVPPEQLAGYLGEHRLRRAECQLAYHNALMVLLWSTAATRDVALAAHALRRLPPPPPGAGWVTYLRGHDDIGWAISDTDAVAVGLDPAAHRRFLADFYAGRHPGSFARGADFQPDPATGDVRTNGTTASLCGIEQALAADDPVLLTDAIRRFGLLHAVLYACPGIPLLFSGDELAAVNDPDWARSPRAGTDNRWAHRPVWDARAARRAADPHSVEAQVGAVLRTLAAARAGTGALRGDGRMEVLDGGDPGVLALLRRHPHDEPVLVVANVASTPRRIPATLLGFLGSDRPVLLAGSDPLAGPQELAGLGWAWWAPAERAAG